LTAVSLAAACASAPPPAAQLTETKQAVSEAEGARAASVPNAQLHLKMAQDQIATAEKLIAEERMEQASLVLFRAEADANLAFQLAREADAQKEAMEAKMKVEALKKGD
jgi:hypothetical protein